VNEVTLDDIPRNLNTQGVTSGRAGIWTLPNMRVATWCWPIDQKG
jgi:hypothetical protein